jgi:hypothetical protein
VKQRRHGASRAAVLFYLHARNLDKALRSIHELFQPFLPGKAHEYCVAPLEFHQNWAFIAARDEDFRLASV